MTTSATYNFNPSLGELALYVLNMVGIRNTAVAQEHMSTLRLAANLALARWSSKGVNLWSVDLQTVALTQGQAAYAVPSNTIAMLDAYITQGTGSGATNRLILPISRTEYASYPNPAQQGFPTTFWFDRLLSPTPDDNRISFGCINVGTGFYTKSLRPLFQKKGGIVYTPGPNYDHYRHMAPMTTTAMA